MNTPLTPLEQQLQKYTPEIFALHMLMKDEMDGGGGERKLSLLIDALLQFNQTKGTGMIYVDFSKGKIGNVDVKIRMTAGTGLPGSK